MHLRRLNVLLPTLGSAGDVHPFIALGKALQLRGHRATLLTNPVFQPLIESQGLQFLAVGSVHEAAVAIGNPQLWHLRKGFKVIAQVIVPAIAEIYRLIESRADADTVVAYSSLCFGARLAQEKLKLPCASVHLQPSVIRTTLGDSGMIGNVRLGPYHPRWFKAGMFQLIDALILDRSLKRPLNEFRATLGLAPIERVMHRWMHSPQLVLAFFPEWFAPPQPDWPPNLHCVGFPLWDSGSALAALNARAAAEAGDAGGRGTAQAQSLAQARSEAQAEEFLKDGAPPVIFTPGSAGSTMQRFFKESVEAARRLRVRAMLVTNFPEQVPRELPPNVRLSGYVPFSLLLPHAALLVYHGGIGTLAQGIKAGVSHLVVPHGYDQFDSGWRIERLGLGRSIPESRYRAPRVARVMAGLLEDSGGQARRREFSARIDSGDTLERACRLLEGLAAGTLISECAD